jgi:hypothetical protein
VLAVLAAQLHYERKLAAQLRYEPKLVSCMWRVGEKPPGVVSATTDCNSLSIDIPASLRFFHGALMHHDIYRAE